MADLPNIPGDVETIVRNRVIYTINRAVQDFLQKDLPRLALEYQQTLTQQMQAAHTGDEFLGQEIIADTAGTITIFVRFTDVDVPFLQGLKFRLVRAAIEIERWIDLTHLDRDVVGIRDVPSWAVEIAFTRSGYVLLYDRTEYVRPQDTRASQPMLRTFLKRRVGN